MTHWANSTKKQWRNTMRPPAGLRRWHVIWSIYSHGIKAQAYAQAYSDRAGPNCKYIAGWAVILPQVLLGHPLSDYTGIYYAHTQKTTILAPAISVTRHTFQTKHLPPSWKTSSNDMAPLASRSPHRGPLGVHPDMQVPTCSYSS